MSWFRTYRPTSFAKLHLDSARQTLQAMAQGQTLPQAFLFAGPKGTGKTSSARILAAMMNDPANAQMVEFAFFNGSAPKKTGLMDPDQKSDVVQRIWAGQSLAVQELDAASNRGIDDIRTLKERSALPPQEGKISVIILDEVHMLTNEAFNALLKVLEEPPAHVVFVLATTELHKIPDTIVSRCLLVPFRLASEQELAAALTEIAAAEKLEVDAAAMTVISQAAQGSFRDAVKYLEQVAQALPAGTKQLTLEHVEQSLHRSFRHQLPSLIQAVLSKDARQVSEIMQQIRQQQPAEDAVWQALLQFLHQELLISVEAAAAPLDHQPVAKSNVLHFLLQELQSIESSQTGIPLLSLELKLLELVFRAQAKRGGGSGSKKVKPKTVALSQPQPSISKPVSVVSPEPELVDVSVKTKKKGDAAALLSQWTEYLQTVAVKNPTLQALLRTTRPLAGTESTAQVAVYYPFHHEQLCHPKFVTILEECAQEIAGGLVSLEFVLSEPPAQPITVSQPAPDHDRSETENLAALAETVLV